jgi:hypothetical protein
VNPHQYDDRQHQEQARRRAAKAEVERYETHAVHKPVPATRCRRFMMAGLPIVGASPRKIMREE